MLLDILKEFPEQPLTFDINTGTNEVKIISDKGEFSDCIELRYAVGGNLPYGFRHGK